MLPFALWSNKKKLYTRNLNLFLFWVESFFMLKKFYFINFLVNFCVIDILLQSSKMNFKMKFKTRWFVNLYCFNFSLRNWTKILSLLYTAWLWIGELLRSDRIVKHLSGKKTLMDDLMCEKCRWKILTYIESNGYWLCFMIYN